MPRKPVKKKTVKKAVIRVRPVSKRKTELERNVQHFSEEVGTLGDKFGERMEEKGKEWDTWFHRTFGIVGPFISAILAILIIALVLWAVNFVNLWVNSVVLTGIKLFIMSNMELLFLIFLFFSYTSYFSKAYPREYIPFSPIIVAAGIVVGLWMAANAFDIVNVSLGNQMILNISLYIQNNFFWIFSFFVFLGYLILMVKISVERPLEKVEERVVMKKPVRKKSSSEIRRVYRSGNDRILGGVCGGIAEYLGVDPVIVRLLWIFGTFAWGFGVLLYIIAWIVIPRNPGHVWD